MTKGLKTIFVLSLLGFVLMVAHNEMAVISHDHDHDHHSQQNHLHEFYQCSRDYRTDKSQTLFRFSLSSPATLLGRTNITQLAINDNSPHSVSPFHTGLFPDIPPYLTGGSFLI
jgi:hypothetical protein